MEPWWCERRDAHAVWHIAGDGGQLFLRRQESEEPLTRLIIDGAASVRPTLTRLSLVGDASPDSISGRVRLRERRRR